jgi:hypothetical protein
MTRYDYFTDYPFHFLGDAEYTRGPMRKIKIISYDRNKYVTVKLETGQVVEIKSGYIYLKPRVPHNYFNTFMETPDD